MPSPFPGMDPYIEANGIWPDFHLEFISACRAKLNRALPDGYAARIEERKQRFIEVVRFPEERLVTSIEILSPANKRPGDDRVAYLAKRTDLLLHQINLVEIDLLLAGRRLPMGAPLPPGTHCTFVTRGADASTCGVYGWAARDPLPTIPIPLDAGAADVALDLAAAFADAYDRGRFDRLLRYDRPPPPPLDAADRDRAAGLAASAGS